MPLRNYLTFLWMCLPLLANAQEYLVSEVNKPLFFQGLSAFNNLTSELTNEEQLKIGVYTFQATQKTTDYWDNPVSATEVREYALPVNALIVIRSRPFANSRRPKARNLEIGGALQSMSKIPLKQEYVVFENGGSISEGDPPLDFSFASKRVAFFSPTLQLVYTTKIGKNKLTALTFGSGFRYTGLLDKNIHFQAKPWGFDASFGIEKRSISGQVLYRHHLLSGGICTPERDYSIFNPAANREGYFCEAGDFASQLLLTVAYEDSLTHGRHIRFYVSNNIVVPNYVDFEYWRWKDNAEFIFGHLFSADPWTFNIEYTTRIYKSQYEKKHALALLLGYQVNKKWKVNLGCQYARIKAGNTDTGHEGRTWTGVMAVEYLIK